MSPRTRVLAPAVAAILALAGCGGDDAAESEAGETPPEAGQLQPTPEPPEEATAQPSGETTAAAPPGSTPGGEEIEASRAEEIALEAVGGGEVTSTELDDLDDTIPVWKVNVRTSSGELREVSVDRVTGEVLENEVDD
jgi:uncharacterized membrane protein YkoI